ncbi:CAZyme family AA3 [Penicillium roqueforti]|nr:CAZyme family AA3 [Penicillium roqueforti]
MRIFQAGSLAISLSVFTTAATASVFQNHTYDYIVVGGGPSGIISAEKFAQAGKKVLLLERGVGPTVATGNNETLTWDHSLTPIDLPGLSADIGSLDVWNQYVCTDTAGTAACVLGGGVTVNYMSVDMIAQPNEKHQVYSYPAWNVKNQMRAGPVRTYLPDATKLDNFHLALQTKVIRLVRSGSQVTGVEVQTASGGSEIITIAPHGRVVLASGALSTPRLLWNSGIGGQAQIETAKKSGVTVPPKAQWIDLPVGVGLKDHPIFSIVFNTNASFGLVDYDGVLNGTDSSDISLYRNHSGVLTQGKHRMIFFTSEEIDGHTQYYQGSCAPTSEGVVTITTYMTHGLTSSGVLGLDASGNTVIVKSPYLQTAADQKAARTFIQKMVNSITAPSTGFELETYTNVSAILGSQTAGIHYTSTAKMGTDDGRKGGTSVVDTNTKVYGVDNLFIVDASIHPDLPTGNIQAAVMVVAEAAAARILSC